ncbi:glycosyltransferase [Vibrio rotiferianus]|uniref:glycosyltransferase n=1 Tax=Vibrio rotiferianus TaxID=190895 RepID=UPI002894FF3E|nr:Glycosyl transferase family protein [Vibrio rotiferianus]
MNSSIHWPKITVVTPSYNQGQYIEETILSVIEQGYPNLEYIVIDGGSHDSTKATLEKYAQHIDYWVSEKDRGQSHAINKGFERASGEILCWLNSDDKFAPGALKAVGLAYISKKTDLVVGICEVYKDDQLQHRHYTSCSDGPLPLYDLLDLDNGWNAGQFFFQPEVFFSRDIWNKAGGAVNEDCFYSMDYELWCRFALHNAELVGIGIPLVHFRSHEEQKTADEDAFKQELVSVRDAFVKSHGLTFSGTTRPPANWTKKLRIAFINDLGFKYGAGIAQLRIAGAFDLATHECAVFDLLSFRQSDGSYTTLKQKVEQFAPDLIIWGNLHAVEPSGVELIREFASKYRSYWLTHDFWLFSGKCPYPAECDKYLTGCDSVCPQASCYPTVPAVEIGAHWAKKHQLLNQLESLTILANSEWSEEYSIKALPSGSPVNVERIRLGVPSEIFRPLDKLEAKHVLGISEDDFAIAFSVSSLSDQRKGGSLLLEALSLLNEKKLHLILIGRSDQKIDLPNITVTQMGYVEDVNQLVLALNAADAYVGPSSEETFGQVFIEAAMCGTPSVGFDITGVKDAICQSITGLKAPEMTAQSLKQTLLLLIENEQLRIDISKCARLYARNFYSLEASYRTFFNVLDRDGVVDKCKVAHKISFSETSSIVTYGTKGWVELTLIAKLSSKSRRVINTAIGLFPASLTGKVRSMLPRWLEIRLMSWLLGK